MGSVLNCTTTRGRHHMQRRQWYNSYLREKHENKELPCNIDASGVIDGDNKQAILDALSNSLFFLHHSRSGLLDDVDPRGKIVTPLGPDRADDILKTCAV